MLTLTLFFSMALIISFLCSLLEAVFLSITPSHLQVELDSNLQRGKILEKLKTDIDRPITAILTLNTVAHTVGAVGVGQQAAYLWSNSHSYIPTLIVPTIMTVSILIFSEIIPKTLGASYWKDLTGFTVYTLHYLLKILYPLINIILWATKAFSSNEHTAQITRKDLIAITQLSSKNGVLDQTESLFLENMLFVKQIKAHQIMTPRSVMLTATESMTSDEFYNLKKQHIFSRIPIQSDDGEEQFVGYVLKDQVIETLVEDNLPKQLSEFLRPIITVPENINTLSLFNKFISSKEHIALVIDDFGSIIGLVTMEDVLETLLGSEIVDETDTAVDMRDMARKKWKSKKNT